MHWVAGVLFYVLEPPYALPVTFVHLYESQGLCFTLFIE